MWSKLIRYVLFSKQMYAHWHTLNGLNEWLRGHLLGCILYAGIELKIEPLKNEKRAKKTGKPSVQLYHYAFWVERHEYTSVTYTNKFLCIDSHIILAIESNLAIDWKCGTLVHMCMSKCHVCMNSLTDGGCSCIISFDLVKEIAATWKTER